MVPDYPGRPPHLADGADEMRRVVRSVLRSGADWIKIMATPGVLGTRPAAPEFATGDGLVAEFTDEELCTAVAEAARRGKGVMAHALGGPAVAACVRAGVRSIEHGLWLTEQDADQMAAAGTTLVPTLGIYARLAAEAAAGALPPEIAGRAAAAARCWVKRCGWLGQQVCRSHWAPTSRIAIRTAPTSARSPTSSGPAFHWARRC